MAGIVAICVLEVSAATNSVRSEDAAMPKTDSDDMIREVLSYELGLVRELSRVNMEVEQR